MTCHRSALIELNRVYRRFEGQTEGLGHVNALEDITLSIGASEFVCITGPSGSGKTTLLNILGCLDSPTKGSYRFGGLEVAEMDAEQKASLRCRAIGFVFQSFQLLEWLDAVQNVEMPATYLGLSSSNRLGRAMALLRSMGLEGRFHHRPQELSGGEQQRVSIARALMNGGRMIVADEPTGALDSEQAGRILDSFENIARDGHTVVVASHDPSIVERAWRVIELRDGRIVADRERTGCDGSPARRGIGSIQKEPQGVLKALGRGIRSCWTRPRQLVLNLLCATFAVASVIVLLAVSEGALHEASTIMGRSGGDEIEIARNGEYWSPNAPLPQPTSEDARAIARIKNVRSASLSTYRILPVRRGEVTIEAGVYATPGEAPPRFMNEDYPLEQGAHISVADNSNRSQVIVIDPQLREIFFEDEAKVIGETLLIDDTPFVVKGVYGRHPVMYGPFYDDLRSYEQKGRFAYVPFTTARQVPALAQAPTSLVAYLEDVDLWEETAQEIDDWIVRNYGRALFVAFPQQKLLNNYWDFVDRKRIILATLAVVSIILGCLGAVSVMLVASRRRVREIGIRMACGAGPKDIRNQFRMEGIIAATFGGAMGVLLGVTVPWAIQNLTETPTSLEPWMLLLGLVGGVLSCALSGLYPANVAANASPAAALRED